MKSYIFTYQTQTFRLSRYEFANFCLCLHIVSFTIYELRADHFDCFRTQQQFIAFLLCALDSD